MIIEIEAHFDAAHRLTFHHGKCKTLHGHTYTVKAQFISTSDSHMVIDFGVAKSWLNSVLAKYDHKTILHKSDPLLNTIPSEMVVCLDDHPTAENIAKNIFNDLKIISDSGQISKIANLISITISEGLAGKAVYAV